MLGTTAYRLVSAGRRSKLGRALTSPSVLAVCSFLAAALGGGALFLLPGSTQDQHHLSVVDAIFLSASAVCVTGLSPVADLTVVLTEQGWWILLGLIQLGGVGVLFLGAMLLGLLGARMPMRHAQALREGFAHTKGGVGRLVVRVSFFMLVAETIGACILRLGLDGSPRPWRDAFFHAASAFCNAGFSTFGKNLEERAHDPLFLLVIAGLIIIGGAGFSTLSETARSILFRRRLSLHSKIVWKVSAVLLVFGAVAFYILERDAILRGRGVGESLLQSFFHSASARTAGFNAVAMDALRPATLLMLVLLMTIGGSPASTAGGVKTVTAAVAVAGLAAAARGRRSATLGNRTIGTEQVQRAMLIVLIHLATLAIAIVALTMSCEHLLSGGVRFLDFVFEASSALGTVGLSTGVTPKLPDGAKILLSIVMLIGRVGPLTVVLAVVPPPRPDAIRFPEERVFLG